MHAAPKHHGKLPLQVCVLQTICLQGKFAVVRQISSMVQILMTPQQSREEVIHFPRGLCCCCSSYQFRRARNSLYAAARACSWFMPSARNLL
jgi:hypothetical protein